MLPLLHLCDSLFPIGGFAYSDGLEAAVVGRAHEAADDLREWLDVCLDETIGHLDGPGVWRAWSAFAAEDWPALEDLDEDLMALRPTSSARRSTRAMGQRLLTTWHALHPERRLAQAIALSADARIVPTLPVAFAGACACSAIGRREAVEGYAYTRLAVTVSAAMRLMSLGQSDAHTMLARTLDRVPPIVDAISASRADLECFAPAMDMAAMRQQYMHSRLFRS